MVFNCEHPTVKKLTPQLINNAEPSFLHQFKWIDDAEIGNLSIAWNYLEGWYPSSGIDLKAIHYTRGGPWFEHMKNCDFANEWITESKKMSANKIQSKTKANHANHY